MLEKVFKLQSSEKFKEDYFGRSTHTTTDFVHMDADTSKEWVNAVDRWLKACQ